MKVCKYPKRDQYKQILTRPAHDTKELEKIARKVLLKVKEKGDKGVRKYTKEFDKVSLKKIMVTEKEIAAAEKQVSEDLQKAIVQAAMNIRRFHEAQWNEPGMIETMPGVQCWRKSVPIEKVGLYIPGGTAPLFSTVLMLGIPAFIAGCKEIVLCSPPNEEGKLHPAILFAAQLVGVTKIFKCGGVQAIAAMAYGTETIPQVYKIFGPGNQYVTCAKQLIQRDGIAIDMPAGPSEVAIYADDTADPSFVAADLLSQAEHGADSQVILVSRSEVVVTRCLEELERQSNLLPRKEIAMKALGNSKAIIISTDEEGADILNEYAPEHLILSCANADWMSERIINAGSVFIGNYSPESVGDYASGTNHVLPTNGYARAYSGVSIDSFVKKITYQKLTEEGLKNIGKTVEQMAEAEGLTGHKNAVTIRLSNFKI